MITFSRAAGVFGAITLRCIFAALRCWVADGAIESTPFGRAFAGGFAMEKRGETEEVMAVAGRCGVMLSAGEYSGAC